MPTNPETPTARPTAPGPSTPDRLRSQIADELRAAMGELIAYGDGDRAHEYAGGQLLELVWGHPPHHCRSSCSAYTGPFACSPGMPAQLTGMTRRPVEGTVLLAAHEFSDSQTRANRVYFEYQREVRESGIAAIWEWLTRVVAKVGPRAVMEALADLAATHDEQDRYAWRACASWHLAVGAYGAHGEGFTVVTTPEASEAGYDPDQPSPSAYDQGLAADDARPFVVCDSVDPYGTRAVAALEVARATRKFSLLPGKRAAALRDALARRQR